MKEVCKSPAINNESKDTKIFEEQRYYCVSEIQELERVMPINLLAGISFKKDFEGTLLP